MFRRLRKSVVRTFVASLAFVITLTGLTSTVVAEPQDVQTVGTTNVCYNHSTYNTLGTVELHWDGVNLTWPTDVPGNVGAVSIQITASGDPGNRSCKFTFDSTGPFLNSNGHQLLPKNALKNGGADLPRSFTVSVPLGAPGGGVDHPDNTYTQNYNLRIDESGIDTDAPAGTYSTTVTITVVAAP